MAKHTVANLPKDTLPEMPLAPGNALAAEPAPTHVTHEGPLPHWLDTSKAKFTQSVVDGMDKKMQERAGTFDVKLKDVQADEEKLKQASSAIPRPRALRGR